MHEWMDELPYDLTAIELDLFALQRTDFDATYIHYILLFQCVAKPVLSRFRSQWWVWSLLWYCWGYGSMYHMYVVVYGSM